ncbi:DNA methyltransferase [Aeromicrobium sp. Leaf245]|nr:DNA methyltransferase [Aeromicrobium sp. Leaf245]
MSSLHAGTASWSSEPGSGRGRSHGTSSREAFDRWFRYPAGFASDYVELLLDRLDLTDGTVIDCFAGSGVTGTAARSRGLSFAGIEAHPAVAELATLKLAPTATGQQVRALASELATKVRGGTGTRAKAGANIGDTEPDLVRRSFSQETLASLIALRDPIKQRIDEPAALYAKWALLATLRDVASVKVGWPYQRPGVARQPRHRDPVARFETRANLMADDLEATAGSPTPSKKISAQVIVGDSSDPAAWSQMTERGVACVASPPYLNNFDYADATRLELFFWGDVSTWGDMCREVRADMLTATTQQSSVGAKETALKELRGRSSDSVGPVSEIVALVDRMVETRLKREKRSKEYDQVAPAYFLSIWDILENLYRQLREDATALWLIGDSAPYGVYIDTPRIIGELAEIVGFSMMDDVRLRERGNRWGQNADRHKVPLTERLIVLTKPG